MIRLSVGERSSEINCSKTAPTAAPTTPSMSSSVSSPAGTNKSADECCRYKEPMSMHWERDNSNTHDIQYKRDRTVHMFSTSMVNSIGINSLYRRWRRYFFNSAQFFPFSADVYTSAEPTKKNTQEERETYKSLPNGIRATIHTSWTNVTDISLRLVQLFQLGYVIDPHQIRLASDNH